VKLLANATLPEGSRHKYSALDVSSGETETDDRERPTVTAIAATDAYGVRATSELDGLPGCAEKYLAKRSIRGHCSVHRATAPIMDPRHSGIRQPTRWLCRRRGQAWRLTSPSQQTPLVSHSLYESLRSHASSGIHLEM